MTHHDGETVSLVLYTLVSRVYGWIVIEAGCTVQARYNTLDMLC